MGELPKDDEREGLTGALLFGNDPDGEPCGSEAVGVPDKKHPLRGALLFGNDPDGEPRGAEAFGKADKNHPLRGALLFGNDPGGEPRGAEVIGKPDGPHPLRGALLFGNDPAGLPRGSEVFGKPWAKVQAVGAAAFGSSDRIPVRLVRDSIGYDFGGVMLQPQATGLSGVRKHPQDRVRERLLGVLSREVSCERDRLRHGLTEDAIPWGRLRRDPELNRQLAEVLRRWYSRAPRNVLGIAQVREILEKEELIHSFSLQCDWDQGPWVFEVSRRGEALARGETRFHCAHRFTAFVSAKHGVIAYADALIPRRSPQVARIRDADGNTLASVTLTVPSADEKPKVTLGHVTRFHAEIRGAKGELLAHLQEKLGKPKVFEAELRRDDQVVGRLTDELVEGRVRTEVEVDFAAPRVVAWSLGVIFAELARLRRDGWPEKTPEPEPNDGPELALVDEDPTPDSV